MAANTIDASGRIILLVTVFSGSPTRSGARFAALILGTLVLGMPWASGQDGSDGEKDNGKKHYLTFQIGYRGTAEQSSQNRFGQSERRLEVNNRFSGRIEVRPEETYDLPTNQSAEAQLKRAEAMQAAVLAGDVEALKTATPQSLVTWFPVGDQTEITGTISEMMTSSASVIEQGETRASSDLATESYSSQKIFQGNLVNAFVKIRAAEKSYDLQFTLMPDMATTWDAVHQTIVSDHREVGHDRHKESEANVPLDMGPGQLALGYSNYQIAAEVKGQPFGSDEGELTGATQIPVPKPAGWNGAWDVVLEVSWQLEITPSPYRLEIEVVPKEYATWRPTTTPTADAGTPLNIVARVVAIDGSKPLVKVAQFEWILKGTSQEPGVALNYPLNAADQRYDLELRASGTGFVLTDAKQRILRREPSGFSDQVQVVPFDWGGWSTLQVTAVLQGGRRLTGRLKGEFEAGLRVPKRARDSNIAAVWKVATGASGADNSDDDGAPVGDETKGDGLTLYEEYRGFYEAGEHTEGTPKTKDFFVRMNDVGIALPGIGKFQRITKLKVHYKLTEQEMPESRIVNANHARGAHLTDQHGVILQIDKKRQGSAIANGGPGNPKMISTVDLMSDVAAFDPRWVRCTVAHELGHCVNLWHHGDSDINIVWAEVEGKFYEARKDGSISDEIFIVNENLDNLGPAVSAMMNAFPKKIMLLSMGRDQGQHSGFENCVMRYDTSQTYVYRKSPDFRIFNIEEPVGDALCGTAGGSGVNEAGRTTPQSRYGPAQALRGDCFHQILVTDAVIAPSRLGAASQP